MSISKTKTRTSQVLADFKKIMVIHFTVKTFETIHGHF